VSSDLPQGEIRSAAFVSDLHLMATAPSRLDGFARFLDGLKSRDIAALFVLGDLFDAWPGDDFLGDPFANRVAALLKAQSDAGMALYFMAGNRDFLIGEGFSGAAGFTILPDPSAFMVAKRLILLSHGDLLCTDDLAYQRFREEVRTSQWRERFLAQSLEQRQRIVGELREASERAKSEKASELMDVNAEAVSALMRTHGEATLLHGHTHRPGRHDFAIDELARERWVLPDWDLDAEPPRGGGIIAKDARLTLIDVEGRTVA
jgi:UDP-2,3-diacylglucosamine hydrolase